MKITVIWDIHWLDKWEAIVNQEKDTDKFVFLWDYFDSFDISEQDQIGNFYKIIKFKESNMDKVVLLLGNHEYHYLDKAEQRYSWYNIVIKLNWAVQSTYEKWYFQLGYKYDKFLITHAGISQSYLDRVGLSVDDVINMDLQDKDNLLMIWHSPSAYAEQSPIRIRKMLSTYPVDWYIQIVGHTGVSEIEENNGIYYVDCLWTSGEYVNIVGDTIEINKVR